MPFDASEIINPKKTLQRRMDQAMESDIKSATPEPVKGTAKFTKAFTPEEKKAQAGKLAEMLRRRTP